MEEWQSAHNTPGIAAAVTRRTPAFEPGGRPAPSSLLGQLWAALTRSTPAFAGTAVPAERRQASGAGPRLRIPVVQQATAASNAATFMGDGPTIRITTEPQVERIKVGFPDDSLQDLTRVIARLSAEVSRLSSRDEELISRNGALLNALSRLVDAQEAVSERTLAAASSLAAAGDQTVGAASDLAARCTELGVLIRQLIRDSENQRSGAAQSAEGQLKLLGRILDIMPPLISETTVGARETAAGEMPQSEMEAVTSTLAKIHYSRGLVLRDLGRYEEALAAFDQALAVDD